MSRPREFDEAEVLHAVLITFWSNGYQGTSMQDLVSASGLQPGSLYGAFGDKHTLFMAALDSYCSEALSKVRLLFEQSEDPLEAARTLVRSAGRDYKNPERAERGCLVGNTSSELAAHDPEARDRVECFLNDMQETVAAGLRRAQEIGSLDANRDPNAMAAFVQCSLQGMALLARTQSNPDVLDGLVNEALRVLGE